MPAACAQVPFSTFVQNVRSNEVLAVAVEDRRFAYKLRPQGKIMRGLPAGPGDVARNAHIVFRTIRPADYSTPYDTMLKNGVQFTAVEKQQSVLLTFAV